MKRPASLFTILVAMVILVSFLFSIRTTRADVSYSIEYVGHTIEVTYNGYIFINDTVRLAGQPPTDFLIGFPETFGPQLLRCIAFNESTTFDVTLDVPLDNHAGFYGVRVGFPSGAPQVFTVGFMLSNSLLTQDAQNMSLFTLYFPEYPSLTKMVGECNASIILPEDAVNITGGTISSTTYRQENLQEFTHSPANMSFLSASDLVQLIRVTGLKREVRISEFGEIDGSDAYEITNRGYNSASSVEVFMPPEASNVVAEDPFGRRMNNPARLGTDSNRYVVNLTLKVDSWESSSFTVRYHLPDSYLIPKGGNGYSFSLPLFRNENYYFDQASINFILPEGARLASLGSNLPNDVYSIERGAFQETITVNRQKIMALDNFTFSFMYDYHPLWSSFRPSLWAWTLSIIGCVVVAVAWKMPKKPGRVSMPDVSVKLQPEHLKAFVEAYEEKKKITLEMESLEARVQKGKIPRRRYKVRTKMLEARLNTLSRSLEEFKEKTRAAGGQYKNLMQQLEIAEAQINEAESNVKNIQSRHNRGELSLEAYRRLLADYQHRRENAETTINGILLRLREETR